MFKLKRAYERPSAADGCRVLVDRLWPRGLTKHKAHLDFWLRDIAPSPRLRIWFGHVPERWQAFQRRYWAELKDRRELVADLRKKGRAGTVTLVYAARDEAHNHALALKRYLNRSR
ncbi:MAG: DUF488 family protein [Planctomycetia bacterium]|nr:DUF488 family protein [Planctomycetia bacterium]